MVETAYKRGERRAFKAKELRKKSEKELMKIMSEIDSQLMKFRGTQATAAAIGGRPEMSRKLSGVDWGLFKVLRQNKARILTVLTEQRRLINKEVA